MWNQDFHCLFFCLKWYHQESNRGHKDFQSFALPTELWHHCYCLFAGAYHSRKFFRIFLIKNARVSEFCSIFAPAIRDLAQLVAHYVRDVGVAGSSPVIPTGNELIRILLASWLISFRKGGTKNRHQVNYIFFLTYLSSVKRGEKKNDFFKKEQ